MKSYVMDIFERYANESNIEAPAISLQPLAARAWTNTTPATAGKPAASAP